MTRHRPHLDSFRIALVASLAVVTVQAVERNATVTREREGAIPSVYYDLRLPFGDVRSGLPPEWPNALLGIQLDQSTSTWAQESINTTPPGTPLDPNREPLEESRTTLTALYQQSLWTPFPWDALFELEASAAAREADNGVVSESELLIADPRVQILFPVWQERYAGVLIGGGVSMPVGQSEDWFNAHDAWGGILSARWSGLVPGVSWLTFAASGEYRMASGATQTIFLQEPNQEEADCDYRGYSVGARLTARVALNWAVSVSVASREDRWDSITYPSGTAAIDEKVRRTGYGAHLTWTQPAKVFWSLGIRNDVPGDDGDSNYAAVIQFTAVPW